MDMSQSYNLQLNEQWVAGTIETAIEAGIERNWSRNQGRKGKPFKKHMSQIKSQDKLRPIPNSTRHLDPTEFNHFLW